MKFINVFNSGMKKDLAKNIFKPDTYFHAENFSLVTEKGLSTGNLRNTKGNKRLISFPNTSNVVNIIKAANGISQVTILGEVFTVDFNSNSWQSTLSSQINSNVNLQASGITSTYTTQVVIYSLLDNQFNVITPVITASINNSNGVLNTSYLDAVTAPLMLGWCLIRNDIYIFTSQELSTTPVNTQSQIWKLTYDKFTNNPNITLIYHGRLNLSLGNPIANPGAVIGNYETPSIQNLYFTDNYNKPKRVNVVDPTLMAKVPSQLEETPDLVFGVSSIQQIIPSGNIEIGNYAVSYRLLQDGGSTTSYFTPSNYIPVFSIQENQIINAYQVDMVVTDSAGLRKRANKSIRAKFFNLDTLYNRIEPVVLFKESQDSVPIIKTLPSQPIPQNGIFEFIFSGNENFTEITLEEFLRENLVFETVKTIASKNNIKFNGNVKYSDFDIDFDARAYRFNHGRQAELTNSQGVLEYTIDGTNPNYNIPETADVIQDPEIKQAPYSYNNFLYQADGLTIGGEGLNIKYEFVQIDPDQVNNPDPYRIGLDTNTTATQAPLANIPHTSTVIDLDQDSFTLYDSISNNGAPDNSTSPYHIYQIKGYQRDEVYRFGVVFFSKKGQASYVKYIGDIRFPNIWMPDTTNPTANNRGLFAYPTITRAGSSVYAHNLGIKFTININSVKDQIDGYRIVRLKRQDSDKTILGQGTVFPTIFNSDAGDDDFGWTTLQNDSYLYDVNKMPSGHVYGSDTVTFISPEFVFKTSPSFSPTDQLDIIGICHLSNNSPLFDNGTPPTVVPRARYFKNYDLIAGGQAKNPPPLQITQSMDVPAPYSTGGPQTYILNTLPFSNQACVGNNVNSGLPPLSYGNKRLALVGAFNAHYGAPFGTNWEGILFDDAITSGTGAIYIANYRRPNSTQYGGRSYSERSYSEYISTGNYRKITAGINTYTEHVYGGDTQVSVFDYVNSFKNYHQGGDYNPPAPGDQSYITEYFAGFLFPTECSFPIQLEDNSTNLCLSKSQLLGDFPWNQNLTGSRIEINQEFKINFDFFVENDTAIFLPKPFPFLPKSKYDVRVHRSAPKTNGELTDSWGIFNEEAYLDADTIQGELNNLIVHQDKLLGFQSKGIVIFSVNERSLTQDTSGSIQLGSGGVLSRYDYISKIIGSQHQFSFTQSHDAVFFFDINTKNIYKLGAEGPEAITVSKNLSSYLGENLDGLIQVSDNPYLNKGITATYDFHYNEALMTFRDTVFVNAEKATISSVGQEVNQITSITFDFGRTQMPSCITLNGIIVVTGYIGTQEITEVGTVTNILGNTITADFIGTQLPAGSSLVSIACASYKSFTLAFNDFVGAFTSFYSFTPPVYINDQRSIFSPDSTDNTLWMHDKGPYGSYYGTIYPSKITLLLNQSPTEVKVFDNYQITSESIDESSEANVVDDTFQTIRIYNDYQNSDFQSLPINAGKQTALRKERNWNISNIRNRVLYTVPSPDIFTDLSVTDKLFGERFRDKALFVDLIYDNANNYRFIFNSFSTDFRKSAR